MIASLLIANRGEIACRTIRTPTVHPERSRGTKSSEAETSHWLFSLLGCARSRVSTSLDINGSDGR